jgi:uncharacterized membrane protein YedE/YeeE
LSAQGAGPQAGGTDAQAPPRESLGVYFLLGVFLGVLFIKSEVSSWFRIQEMFRFQSFHMYGVIGSAVAVGSLSVFLMKRAGARTVRGEAIDFSGGEPDVVGAEHVFGGTTFGLGWGLVGACPGPLYALIGAGYGVMVVGLLAAMTGAWTYGLLRPRLPHGPMGSGPDSEMELAGWR